MTDFKRLKMGIFYIYPPIKWEPANDINLYGASAIPWIICRYIEPDTTITVSSAYTMG